ncbi:MAG TPA: hypothetical protein VH414_12875 [Lichenihabitans sp.]|nr:hypothetical protein [Lichenihabitans sp.]
MPRPSDQFDYMDLDDFEELLVKPGDGTALLRNRPSTHCAA